MSSAADHYEVKSFDLEGLKKDIESALKNKIDLSEVTPENAKDKIEKITRNQ